MKILSLNVSKPKVVRYRGQKITTGIYKTPVHGPHQVRATNIDGDGQADLAVHGGPDKAVYAFPSEHYVRYQKTLDHEPYEFGRFGENLTTEGMFEAESVSATSIGSARPCSRSPSRALPASHSPLKWARPWPFACVCPAP